jgi:hypothetical protein
MRFFQFRERFPISGKAPGVYPYFELRQLLTYETLLPEIVLPGDRFAGILPGSLIQDTPGIEFTDEFGDQRGPAGLMAGAQAMGGISMKIFVE